MYLSLLLLFIAYFIFGIDCTAEWAFIYMAIQYSNWPIHQDGGHHIIIIIIMTFASQKNKKQGKLRQINCNDTPGNKNNPLAVICIYRTDTASSTSTSLALPGGEPTDSTRK